MGTTLAWLYIVWLSSLCIRPRTGRYSSGILAKLHGMLTTSDIYGVVMTGALLEVCQLPMSS